MCQPTPDGTDDQFLGTFQLFCDRYSAYVRAIIWNLYMRDDPAEDLDDLMQDVFVAAWREYAKLKDSRSCHGWLRVVARDTVLLRRRRYFHRLHSSSLETRWPTNDELETLEEQIADVPTDFDAGLALDDLRAALVPEDLELLSLWADGFQHSEIAAACGTSVEATRRRLARARDRALGRLTADLLAA
jgi:RNA polymerase sigma factor (sigma-70 family)